MCWNCGSPVDMWMGRGSLSGTSPPRTRFPPCSRPSKRMADLCRVVHEIPPVYDAVFSTGTRGTGSGRCLPRFFKARSRRPTNRSGGSCSTGGLRFGMCLRPARSKVRRMHQSKMPRPTTSPPSCKPPASGRSAPPAQRPLPFIEGIPSRRQGFPRWRCPRPAPQTAPVRLNPSAPAIK